MPKRPSVNRGAALPDGAAACTMEAEYAADSGNFPQVQ